MNVSTKKGGKTGRKMKKIVVNGTEVESHGGSTKADGAAGGMDQSVDYSENDSSFIFEGTS